MNNADEYIQTYKELEKTVRSIYQLPKEQSISNFLKNSKRTRLLNIDIEYCADVRNLLQHREKISDEYPVIPTDEMIDYVRSIIDKLNNRPRSHEIAIPKSKILSATLDSSLRKTMNAMRNTRYTHVPIIEHGKVIGVLSQSSIFNYIADQGIVDIDDELLIKDLKDYLSLKGDDIVIYTFQPSSIFVDELLEVFEDEFQKGNRIGMVFLTPNGNPDEELTGILTPWDVLVKSHAIEEEHEQEEK